ncbi:MAG: DNA repair protein [Proteobacteria bacterium]|nr:DNA repair protein [Pseudomonadota bacterium]
MKKATLMLSNINLKPHQIHKLRGFIGNLFIDHDLIHNHNPETGKHIYRYPLIQFKLIGKMPAIIALSEKAVCVFAEIFMKLNEIKIDNTIIPVHEKDLKVEDAPFGYTEETFMYEFMSPWIGLNQFNYKRYADNSHSEEKQNLLKQAMTGNVLSMAKGLEYWLEEDQRIKLDLNLKEKPVNLKGKSMIGFTGRFKVNFMIPDYLGLGKSVSRGFGGVRKIL